MNKTIYWLIAMVFVTGIIFSGCVINPADDVEEPTNTTVSEESAEEAEDVKVKVYEDGTYTETVSYLNPSGDDEIDVTITLKDNVLSDLKIAVKADDKTSQKFQQLFIDGINELVVGQNIDEIEEFDSVNGASLTTVAFQKAVEAVKNS